jgi:hypothetical protein
MGHSLLGSSYNGTKCSSPEDLLGRKLRLDFVLEYGTIVGWLKAGLLRVPVPSSRI